MSINPILWLYALRLGQVGGALSILLAPVLLLEPQYFSYAFTMLGLGLLGVLLPYAERFKKTMDLGMCNLCFLQI